jgi:acyl carrier protein
MNMSREVILARLRQIFQEVFDDPQLQVGETTTARDIPEWDSLMHVTLVISIEKEFGLELHAREVGQLENVGAMVDVLMQKVCTPV